MPLDRCEVGLFFWLVGRVPTEDLCLGLRRGGVFGVA